jgi:hypothetical protein
MVTLEACACTSSALTELQDPASGEKVEKNVFVVFFTGERVRVKVMKVGLCVRGTMLCVESMRLAICCQDKRFVEARGRCLCVCTETVLPDIPGIEHCTCHLHG